MNRFARLQLIGPFTLAAVIFAAEAAVYGLEHHTSAFLWYVNLQWFPAFQASYYIISKYISVPYSQLFFVAIPLVVIACAGMWTKRPFLLAIGSNLSFVYTVFVVYAWLHTQTQGSPSASLVPMVASTNPDGVLCLVLLGACLCSFFVSHLIYVRAVRAAG